MPEALQRLCRAVLAVGDRYLVLLGERMSLQERDTTDNAHQRVAAPIQALFQRGQEAGILRDDLDATLLVQLFGATVVAALHAGLPRTLGVEQAAALSASLFLDGARRQATPRRSR